MITHTEALRVARVWACAIPFSTLRQKSAALLAAYNTRTGYRYNEMLIAVACEASHKARSDEKG